MTEHLNENFIYSNPQVGMSFIFELNDKINYINRKDMSFYIFIQVHSN